MKKARRFINYLSLLVFILVSLSGCNGSTPQDTSGSGTPTPVSDSAMSATTINSSREGSGAGNEKVRAGKFKIGMNRISSVDAQAEALNNFFSLIEEDLGVEFVYYTEVNSPEKQLLAIQELVDRDCDALILTISNQTILPEIIRLCDDNQIPFALVGSFISDPDMKKMAASSKYYLGSTSENDSDMAYSITSSIIEQGSHNIAVITPHTGLSSLDARYSSINQAINSFGAKKLAEFRVTALSPEDVSKAVETFLEVYPELDGIIAVYTGNGIGEAILETLEKHGKSGTIKFGGLELFDSAGTAFKEQKIHSLACGNYVDPLFSFVLLYNYLAGTPLSDKPVEIKLNFMQIDNSKDIENYYKYCQSTEFPYNIDEIRLMIKYYNPDMTAHELKAIAARYSIYDVMGRHGIK
ncbi:MAG: sugar ABC transporter substrate-binding protein [Clostridiales bacterium]|nr:sugar ABC transporter substrate-binding protein [Clostridiales bacterium]